MAHDETAAERYALRQVTRYASDLDRALTEVINRATAERDRLREGQRITGGLGSLLSHAPANVERYAAALEVALEAAASVRVDDAELLAAYTSRDL